MIAGLQYLFYHTALGRAFRAKSDDAEIAELMRLCLGVMGIAGVFLLFGRTSIRSWGPVVLLLGSRR